MENVVKSLDPYLAGRLTQDNERFKKRKKRILRNPHRRRQNYEDEQTTKQIDKQITKKTKRQKDK
jgi:hypothetical protein